jgi:hypothetical protein
MKFLAMLLSCWLHRQPLCTMKTFPSLSDQILWKTEREVCQSDPYECVGLSHMSIRCCRIRVGLI